MSPDQSTAIIQTLNKPEKIKHTHSALRTRTLACYLFQRNRGSLISKENSQFFSPIKKPEQSPAPADLRAVNEREWWAVLGCSQPHSTFIAWKRCQLGVTLHPVSTPQTCNSHTFALIYYLLTDADKCSWKLTEIMVSGECLMVEMSKIIWLNIHILNTTSFETSTYINRFITVSLNY